MGEAEKSSEQGLQALRRSCPRTSRSRPSSRKARIPTARWCARWCISNSPAKPRATIHGRVLALFPDKDHPDPEDLIEHQGRALRGAGLSRQKTAALKDVAQKRIDGIIPPARALSRLPDEEIIERLTAARGVGRWTVEMYLIFTLGRPDVLPIDDLGVRKGAEKLYSRSFTPKELGAYGERWAPWRSAAAWHLWRVADTQTPEQSKI